MSEAPRRSAPRLAIISPLLPAMMSPLRSVGSSSILICASPSGPCRCSASLHQLVAIAIGVRQVGIRLSAFGDGILDVTAIDHLGLGGRAKTAAGSSPAPIAGRGDRKIATVAGAHAIGLRVARIGVDPRAARIRVDPAPMHHNLAFMKVGLTFARVRRWHRR